MHGLGLHLVRGIQKDPGKSSNQKFLPLDCKRQKNGVGKYRQLARNNYIEDHD